MTRRRDIRRCALQALYQLDTRGTESLDLIRESLADSPGDEAVHQKGFDLAMLAWEFHEEADAAVAACAPDWPTHRQPVLDRNMLRLAYYEMVHGETPPKVAINEAVELAKEFGTERSYLFINGVLDKILRSTVQKDAPGESTPNP